MHHNPNRIICDSRKKVKRKTNFSKIISIVLFHLFIMKSLKIIMILASLSETVAVSWSRHCSSSSHHPLSVRHIISGKADSCCDCGWFSLRGGGRRRRDETDNDTYEQKRNRGGNRKQQRQRYFDLQETEEDEQFPASFLDEEDIKEQEKIISALSKKD